jgi:hypothetical protein
MTDWVADTFPAAPQAARAQRAEFRQLAGLPPSRRTIQQNNRLAMFLSSCPRTLDAGPSAVHALSLAVQVTAPRTVQLHTLS